MGVVYHPPKPSYDVVSFLEYLEAEVDEIMRTFPTSEIVMVGDFDQLSDTDLIQRTGLMQIVDQPTRGANRLDRIFESSPIHAGVRVVTSAEKAIIWLSSLIPGVARQTSTRSELYYNIDHALLTNMQLFWLTYLTRTGTMF